MVAYLTFYFVLSPILEPVKSIYAIAFSEDSADNTAEASLGKDMLSGKLGVYEDVIKASEIHFPYVGDKWGEITIESVGIKDLPLIYGDSRKLLLQGACLSERSRLPGFGGGTLIGAHKYSFFHELEYVKEGDEVVIETYYGKYIYKVYKTQIIDVENTTDYWDDVYGEHETETLALYSCYVSDTIRSTNYRFFAFCELLSGPQVDEYS